MTEVADDAGTDGIEDDVERIETHRVGHSPRSIVNYDLSLEDAIDDYRPRVPAKQKKAKTNTKKNAKAKIDIQAFQQAVTDAKTPIEVANAQKALRDALRTKDGEYVGREENGVRYSILAQRVYATSFFIKDKLKNIRNLSDEDLDDVLRAIGYENSLAHKGRGNHENINDKIYNDKGEVLPLLVDEFLRRGREVAYNGNEIDGWVLYFRTHDGVQISFHAAIPKSVEFDKSYEWDGIRNAFAYDGDTYRKIKENLSAQNAKNLEDYNKRMAVLHKLQKEDRAAQERYEKEGVLNHAIELYSEKIDKDEQKAYDKAHEWYLKHYNETSAEKKFQYDWKQEKENKRPFDIISFTYGTFGHMADRRIVKYITNWLEHELPEYGIWNDYGYYLNPYKIERKDQSVYPDESDYKPVIYGGDSPSFDAPYLHDIDNNQDFQRRFAEEISKDGIKMGAYEKRERYSIPVSLKNAIMEYDDAHGTELMDFCNYIEEGWKDSNRKTPKSWKIGTIKSKGIIGDIAAKVGVLPIKGSILVDTEINDPDIHHEHGLTSVDWANIATMLSDENIKPVAIGSYDNSLDGYRIFLPYLTKENKMIATGVLQLGKKSCRIKTAFGQELDMLNNVTFLYGNAQKIKDVTDYLRSQSTAAEASLLSRLSYAKIQNSSSESSSSEENSSIQNESMDRKRYSINPTSVPSRVSASQILRNALAGYISE